MHRCSFPMSCNAKAALRAQFKTVRSGVKEKERVLAEQNIAQKVLELVDAIDAKCVFAYLSFGSEVGTKDLLENLLQKGIAVAVPRCDANTHTMDAVGLRTMEELKPGAYGILEPMGQEIIPKEQIDLILVPGLAFDNDGYRLGYGGGYYDRYLNGFQGVTAGLTFAACLVDTLPREPYDLAVQYVISERELKKVKQ